MGQYSVLLLHSICLFFFAVILQNDHQLVFCFSSLSSSSSSSSSSSNLSSTAATRNNDYHLCPFHQSHALLQFKQSFIIHRYASLHCHYYGQVSYPKTMLWNASSDCCTWDGVACDEFSGEVVGLDLSCSQLQGPIHSNSTLFQLSHLHTLNLAFNDFSLSKGISHAFGGFTNLIHLNLSYCQISGQIPSEISHLSKLVSLDISSYFDINIKVSFGPHNFKMLLQNLTQLSKLFLDGVNIGSDLPKNLSSSLTSIRLFGTMLRGNLPDHIFDLPNLKSLDHILTGNIPKVNGSSLEMLDLSFNAGLFGELPDSMSHLKSLNILRLSYCRFSGYIPKSLWNLAQLTYLSLRENNFTGEIPSTLSNLEKLTFLDLSDNYKLEGQILGSLTNLGKLRSLYLQSNNFNNGQFPTLILNNLTQLEYLDISKNSLMGPIPPNSSELPNLVYLLLSQNSLNGGVPSWLFALPSLLRLDISSNRLDGQIGEFGYSPLQSIHLSNNQLHGTIPKSISKLVNLTRLNLSSNNLSGVVELNMFSNLKKLEELDLRSNLLEGPLPIPSSLDMSYFFMSNNKLSGEISSLICNLSLIEIIDLSNNSLTGVIPQCLANFSSVLTVLDLRMNGFFGTIPDTFSKGNKLRNLDLNGNQLEGRVPLSLCNCTELEVLDLGNNNIADTFPHCLASLPKLQVLVLKSNRFYGPIFTPLTKLLFPKLRIIDLSHNNFTGHLPNMYFKNFKAMMNVNDKEMKLEYIQSQFGYYRDSVTLVLKGVEIELLRILTVFTTIDLSSNNFQGEIPKFIGDLNSLHLLNLSHNNLIGHIPPYMGNMTKLESLDLSSNQLMGEIPGQLTSLKSLAVLNLSQNHLVGEIPRGTQFDTFPNDSYSGNLALCGFPLSKSCREDKPPQPTVFPNEDDSEFFSGFTWKSVVMGYGCGIVFGLVMGCTMFQIGKPKWFVGIVEREQHKRSKRSKKSAGHGRGRRRLM